MAKKTQAELQAIVDKRESAKQFAAEARAVVSEYSDEERETWPIQLQEAKAYFNDPSTATPLLDGMISESGETKAELVNNIIQKDNNFRMAIGKALGRKRKREQA